LEEEEEAAPAANSFMSVCPRGKPDADSFCSMLVLQLRV
jgi:hypothetical protein